jgi:hypothetical protein
MDGDGEINVERRAKEIEKGENLERALEMEGSSQYDNRLCLIVLLFNSYR